MRFRVKGTLDNISVHEDTLLMQVETKFTQGKVVHLTEVDVKAALRAFIDKEDQIYSGYPTCSVYLNPEGGATVELGMVIDDPYRRSKELESMMTRARKVVRIELTDGTCRQQILEALGVKIPGEPEEEKNEEEREDG